jgi:transposase
MDARHANAALKVMPAKTDRNDAIGLVQIVHMGWRKSIHVKSTASHEVRALLATRSQFARGPCDLENQIRGVLRAFGILFGKRVGSPMLRPVASPGRKLLRRRSFRSDRSIRGAVKMDPMSPFLASPAVAQPENSHLNGGDTGLLSQ